MKLHLHAHPDLSHSKTALKIAIAATIAVFAMELAGALWTNSLALLSDSAHVFMDFFSFTLSYLAILLAERPISDRRTFGWHRIEVFAAFINGSSIGIVSLLILVQAARRLLQPVEIMGQEMLIIAGLGLAANLFVIWKLHPHAGKDVNVRSAFLHAFGDALASVAVVVGGALYLWTGNPFMDSCAAIVVALVIAAGSWRVLRESVHILLEGVPLGVDSTQVVASIEEVAGKGSVRDLHIWNLCSHLCALSVHLTLPQARMAEQQKVLERTRLCLGEKYNIIHSTIQIESDQWKEESHG